MSDVPKRIEIARFPGNKRFALTFSWDDGVVEDRPLVEFMNEHGLKGTFNLNSAPLARGDEKVGQYGRILASEVASLYAGHEVAIHTVTHPWLEKLDVTQIATEVLDDRKALEDLVGYPVRGMAYPFGTYSPRVIEVLRALGIVYCRTTQRVEDCFPTQEPLAWHTTSHVFTQEPANVADRFQQWRDNPRKSGVFFVWGHSYEFGRQNDRWADMPRLLKPLAGHEDVWYCTNIQLFDYEAARQRMVIAANRRTAFNPSGMPVTLVVDGKPVDVPPGQTVTFAAIPKAE